MSVHGEFGRALQSVIGAVEMLEPATASPHREALEEARLAHQPNRESAARAALTALSALSELEIAGAHLPTAAAHLDAHCRAILGLPAEAD